MDLNERDDFKNDDERRRWVVSQAVEAVQGFIGEHSDGSVEETQYLTGEVALELVKVAVIPFNGNLLKHDMNKKEEKDD